MLFNRDELLRRARTVRSFAMDSLSPVNESIPSRVPVASIHPTQTFDIFLSHRYEDRDAVKGLADELVNDFKYSVYIDWIVDPSLDRSKVNGRTAEILRNRLSHSRCLWYVTSDDSAASKWMPWETGFADGKTGRVAICPLVSGQKTTFTGVEYLSMYPYVDRCKAKGSDKVSLWINESIGVYCSFDKWLNENSNPVVHK